MSKSCKKVWEKASVIIAPFVEKKINPFVRIGQCKNSTEYMHTKKIDIYIFIYCIYLTVDYRHKERYRDSKSEAHLQSLSNRSSCKECT